MIHRSIDDAKSLARLIRQVPGWRAKPRLIIPLDDDDFTGGWMAVAARQGDPATYLVRNTEELEILLRQLAEGGIE